MSGLIKIAALSFGLFTACEPIPQPTQVGINEKGKTICERFAPPQNFVRKSFSQNSFEYYLQHFPLKDSLAKVYYYNGELKPNQKAAKAVLDIDVGTQNLQQCADAVIRLRAEYLYKEKEYNKIAFCFTSGFKADYVKWAEGYRIQVNGNNVSWYKSQAKDYAYKTFRKYLNIVFSYAGTLSLTKELTPVKYNDISVGDVLIQGGSPGHAVLVVDIAEDTVTKQKAFLLVQSYMPAQSIHLLANNEDNAISPWYVIDNETEVIKTPEWVFYKKDVKRFK